MSRLECNSDQDMDLSELKEDVSVQLVKSSTQAQFLVDLNTPTQKCQKKSQNAKKSPISRPQKLKTTLSDIFYESKSPIIRPSDINERCFKFKERVKAKIEKMAHDQEEIRKKDCPFRPQLLNNKRSSRKLTEFLAEMKNFEISKDKKIVNMRLKQNYGEGVKETKLRPTGVHEKLYNEGRTIKKIGDRNKATEKAKNFWISDNVLAENFKSEFNQVIFDKFGDEKIEFCFEEFFFLLLELNFIRNDSSLQSHQDEIETVYRAWEWISNNEPWVFGERVLNFLLEVMNYEDEAFGIDENDVHREFIGFYECRHWFVINKKRKKARECALTPSDMSISPHENSRKSLSQDQTCEKYVYIPSNIFNKGECSRINGSFYKKK